MESERRKSSGIGEKAVVGFRAGDEAMLDEGEVEDEKDVDVDDSESENASVPLEVDAKRYDDEGMENEPPLSRRLTCCCLEGMS